METKPQFLNYYNYFIKEKAKVYFNNHFNKANTFSFSVYKVSEKFSI